MMSKLFGGAVLFGAMVVCGIDGSRGKAGAEEDEKSDCKGHEVVITCKKTNEICDPVGMYKKGGNENDFMEYNPQQDKDGVMEVKCAPKCVAHFKDGTPVSGSMPKATNLGHCKKTVTPTSE